MSELIDRQAALDALTEWYDNDDDKRSAKDVIRELPQEQQWSCGKPKHIGRYIVTYWSRLHDDEQCRVQIMRFQNGHWVYPIHIPEWINGEIEEEVLAWCELPKPWEVSGYVGVTDSAEQLHEDER